MASTDTQLHVIVGASGAVGIALARYLAEQTCVAGANIRVQTVARGQKAPKQLQDLVTEGKIQHVAGDSMSKESIVNACTGASTIYNCIGFKEYNSTVWARDWPIVIDNLLAAAEAAGAVLVHADNVYSYGPDTTQPADPTNTKDRSLPTLTLTSTTPYTTSKTLRKPAIRAALNRTLENAHKQGRVRTCVVRAADFYGAGITNSMLGEHVFPSLMTGSRVWWMAGPVHARHSYTYVPDFAKALAISGTNEKAWGRAWHVPNAPAATIGEVVEICNTVTGKKSKVSGVSPCIMKTMGLFVGVLAEVNEMSYQFTAHFNVVSDFQDTFPEFGTPTPLTEGLKNTLSWYSDSKQQ